MPTPPPSAKKRDSQSTRLKLLLTAEQVFVDKGFDGTRVDDIAARAGVNKRMIYVYFGSKEHLYLEVLQANLARTLEASRGALDEAGGPTHQAKAAISRYFSYCADHPSFVRLLSWESLNGGKRMQEVLTNLASAGLQDLYDVISRGVSDGSFRADLDVRRFVFSVHALCVSYFSRRELLETMWGEDFSIPAVRSALLNHILSLVLRGILVDSAALDRDYDTKPTGGTSDSGGFKR